MSFVSLSRLCFSTVAIWSEKVAYFDSVAGLWGEYYFDSEAGIWGAYFDSVAGLWGAYFDSVAGLWGSTSFLLSVY